MTWTSRSGRQGGRSSRFSNNHRERLNERGPFRWVCDSLNFQYNRRSWSYESRNYKLKR
nr:MAG TPA: urocanase [Caudoviricetes sp.]